MPKTLLVLFLLSLTACGQGPQGPAGPQGVRGDRGETGPGGADGTAVTLVPLCPGVANYGVFVEQALCINGKLYGVYSAHGGFLAHFADGEYKSNAIGSACNLTVSGCTVTHE
jgi:hypothetical protein